MRGGKNPGRTAGEQVSRYMYVISGIQALDERCPSHEAGSLERSQISGLVEPDRLCRIRFVRTRGHDPDVSIHHDPQPGFSNSDGAIRLL